MRTSTRTIVAIVAAGALLALPAAGTADTGKGNGKGAAKGQAKPKPPKREGSGEAKRCAKTQSVGYTVRGTLVSVTPDDPATPASEATVTITVTGANRHARDSGEIADQDAAKPGVQVAGATYTVPAGDAFSLKLDGYQPPDTPSAGDDVHIRGKIARTKKKCAPAGTTTADRYAAPDVRKVTIHDRDPDA